MPMLNRLPAKAWIVTAVLICGAVIGIQAFQFWTHWSAWNAPSPVRTLSPPEQKRVQPNVIVSRHLFGQPVKQVAEPVVPENLPETHLRLTLRGVADGTDNDIEGALIEGPDRRTDFYRTGESLPGGAVLRDIRSDSVVLDRSGRLETLSFPEDTVSDDSFVVVSDETDSVQAENDEGGSENTDSDTLPPPEVVTQDPDALETLPSGDIQGSPVIDEKRREEIREKLRKLKAQIQAQSQ
ncbi:MAG: hypothetical protein D6758_12690 [Gammaproteobacteria bacterium]|nr:MAG: hypothetical protein D6758_12690 [Gammaproteobacteria bacterium]